MTKAEAFLLLGTDRRLDPKEKRGVPTNPPGGRPKHLEPSAKSERKKELQRVLKKVLKKRMRRRGR